MNMRPDSTCDSFTKHLTKTINISGIQVVNFVLSGMVSSQECLRFEPKVVGRRKGEKPVIIFLYG